MLNHKITLISFTSKKIANMNLNVPHITMSNTYIMIIPLHVTNTICVSRFDIEI